MHGGERLRIYYWAAREAGSAHLRRADRCGVAWRRRTGYAVLPADPSLEPGVSPAHIGYARPITGPRPGRPRHGHCFLINLSLSLSLSLSLAGARKLKGFRGLRGFRGLSKGVFWFSRKRSSSSLPPNDIFCHLSEHALSKDWRAGEHRRLACQVHTVCWSSQGRQSAFQRI